jgi:hypothetical protein
MRFVLTVLCVGCTGVTSDVNKRTRKKPWRDLTGAVVVLPSSLFVLGRSGTKAVKWKLTTTPHEARDGTNTYAYAYA